MHANSNEQTTFADHSPYDAQWAGYTGSATIIQPTTNGGVTVVTQDENDDTTIISNKEDSQLEPIDNTTLNNQVNDDAEKENVPQNIDFLTSDNNPSALLNPELEIL